MKTLATLCLLLIACGTPPFEQDCSIDIDHDGKIDAVTDGALLLEAWADWDLKRNSYVHQCAAQFDVDGNAITGEYDISALFNYMTGAEDLGTGEEGCTRCSDPEIRGYIRERLADHP